MIGAGEGKGASGGGVGGGGAVGGGGVVGGGREVEVDDVILPLHLRPPSSLPTLPFPTSYTPT